jgi:hypothetical protein
MDASTSFTPIQANGIINMPPNSPVLRSPRLGDTDGQRVLDMAEINDLRRAIQRFQSNNAGNQANGGGGISVSSTTPEGIAKWYSQQSFKVITFFLFCVSVLAIITTALFIDKLSTDQFLGMLSSLLFLMAPSPLDLIKKKKKETVRIV